MKNILAEIAQIEQFTKEDIYVLYSEISKKRFTGDGEQKLNILDTRAVVELLEKKVSKRESVYVLIQTTGGHVAEAVSIIDEFRKHYNKVNFVIMTYAGSAGAYMSLSGDTLYMRSNAMLSDFGPQNWYLGPIETPEDLENQTKVLGELYGNVVRQLSEGTMKNHLKEVGTLIVKLGGPAPLGQKSQDDRIHGSALTIDNMRALVPGNIEHHDHIPAPGNKTMNYVANNFEKLSLLVRKAMVANGYAKLHVCGGEHAAVKFNKKV